MTKRTINKTEFILVRCSGLSAAEVVAKAKAAGFKLSDKYVYNVRSKAKQLAEGPVDNLRRKQRRVEVPGLAKKLLGAEHDFAGLVLQLGVRRAREIVDRIATTSVF